MAAGGPQVSEIQPDEVTAGTIGLLPPYAKPRHAAGVHSLALPYGAQYGRPATSDDSLITGRSEGGAMSVSGALAVQALSFLSSNQPDSTAMQHPANMYARHERVVQGPLDPSDVARYEVKSSKLASTRPEVRHTAGAGWQLAAAPTESGEGHAARAADEGSAGSSGAELDAYQHQPALLGMHEMEAAGGRGRGPSAATTLTGSSTTTTAAAYVPTARTQSSDGSGQTVPSASPSSASAAASYAGGGPGGWRLGIDTGAAIIGAGVGGSGGNGDYPSRHSSVAGSESSDQAGAAAAGIGAAGNNASGVGPYASALTYTPRAALEVVTSPVYHQRQHVAISGGPSAVAVTTVQEAGRGGDGQLLTGMLSHMPMPPSSSQSQQQQQDYPYGRAGQAQRVQRQQQQQPQPQQPQVMPWSPPPVSSGVFSFPPSGSPQIGAFNDARNRGPQQQQLQRESNGSGAGDGLLSGRYRGGGAGSITGQDMGRGGGRGGGTPSSSSAAGGAGPGAGGLVSALESPTLGTSAVLTGHSHGQAGAAGVGIDLCIDRVGGDETHPRAIVVADNDAAAGMARYGAGVAAVTSASAARGRFEDDQSPPYVRPDHQPTQQVQLEAIYGYYASPPRSSHARAPSPTGSPDAIRSIDALTSLARDSSGHMGMSSSSRSNDRSMMTVELVSGGRGSRGSAGATYDSVRRAGSVAQRLLYGDVGIDEPSRQQHQAQQQGQGHAAFDAVSSDADMMIGSSLRQQPQTRGIEDYDSTLQPQQQQQLLRQYQIQNQQRQRQTGYGQHQQQRYQESAGGESATSATSSSRRSKQNRHGGGYAGTGAGVETGDGDAAVTFVPSPSPSSSATTDTDTTTTDTGLSSSAGGSRRGDRSRRSQLLMQQQQHLMQQGYYDASGQQLMHASEAAAAASGTSGQYDGGGYYQSSDYGGGDDVTAADHSAAAGDSGGNNYAATAGNDSAYGYAGYHQGGQAIQHVPYTAAADVGEGQGADSAQFQRYEYGVDASGGSGGRGDAGGRYYDGLGLFVPPTSGTRSGNDIASMHLRRLDHGQQQRLQYQQTHQYDSSDFTLDDSAAPTSGGGYGGRRGTPSAAGGGSGSSISKRKSLLSPPPNGRGSVVAAGYNSSSGGGGSVSGGARKRKQGTTTATASGLDDVGAAGFGMAFGYDDGSGSGMLLLQEPSPVDESDADALLAAAGLPVPARSTTSAGGSGGGRKVSRGHPAGAASTTAGRSSSSSGTVAGASSSSSTRAHGHPTHHAGGLPLPSSAPDLDISEAQVKETIVSKDGTLVHRVVVGKRTISSRYRGVSMTKGGHWRVQLGFRGRRVSVGHFQDENEAAKAYDRVARALQGNEAILNFPGAVYTPFECTDETNASVETALRGVLEQLPAGSPLLPGMIVPSNSSSNNSGTGSSAGGGGDGTAEGTGGIEPILMAWANTHGHQQPMQVQHRGGSGSGGGVGDGHEQTSKKPKQGKKSAAGAGEGSSGNGAGAGKAPKRPKLDVAASSSSATETPAEPSSSSSAAAAAIHSLTSPFPTGFDIGGGDNNAEYGTSAPGALDYDAAAAGDAAGGTGSVASGSGSGRKRGRASSTSPNPRQPPPPPASTNDDAAAAAAGDSGYGRVARASGRSSQAAAPKSVSSPLSPAAASSPSPSGTRQSHGQADAASSGGSGGNRPSRSSPRTTSSSQKPRQ